MKTVLKISSFLFTAAMFATPAFAADTWVQCQGNVVSVEKKGAQPQTQPAQQVMVIDDSIQHLYRYSDDKKSMAMINTRSFSPKEITWGEDLSNSGGMKWDGTLDRGKMALKIERSDREGGTMTWSEKCQPTQPLLGAQPQVAAHVSGSTATH